MADVIGDTMKVAIMQPYFLPYIGYFQLINAVDTFVVYDDIKYTKKGWINRNRFLLDGHDKVFSLPLQAGSNALDVRERNLAPDFNRTKLLNQLNAAYRKAPCFEPVWPLLQEIVGRRESNLFRFIHASIEDVCRFLGVNTQQVISSTLDIDHALVGQDKVMAICRRLGATSYINAIGGRELYSRDAFAAQGMQLEFLQSRPHAYTQFERPFVPWLSILDVMMFNQSSSLSHMLMDFDLV